MKKESLAVLLLALILLLTSIVSNQNWRSNVAAVLLKSKSLNSSKLETIKQPVGNVADLEPSSVLLSNWQTPAEARSSGLIGQPTRILQLDLTYHQVGASLSLTSKKGYNYGYALANELIRIESERYQVQLLDSANRVVAVKPFAIVKKAMAEEFNADGITGQMVELDESKVSLTVDWPATASRAKIFKPDGSVSLDLDLAGTPMVSQATNNFKSQRGDLILNSPVSKLPTIWSNLA